MIDAALLDKFIAQLDSLNLIVNESSKRVIAEDPDKLFLDYQNVFIKSYLVSACSVLEAFIQDLAESYAVLLRLRIEAANLPYNFVTWSTDHEKAKLKYIRFESKKSKKDISDMISPNYFKTMSAFQRMGVDISTVDVESFKDYVSSVVDKRNKIVHHNDAASDLSFSDIAAVIQEFRKYVKCLYDAVCESPHMKEA